VTGPIFLGYTPLIPPGKTVGGGFVQLGGEAFYRIENVAGMEPFFMTVVSGSDHWMFVSSRGGLTAGRRDADGALFPYTTDDRVHDSSGRRGPRTVLFVTRKGHTARWEPFASAYLGVYEVVRNLYKNVAGTRLVFEEVNKSLGMTYRYAWTSGERFGLQRQVTLSEDRNEPAEVSLLDGLLDILPASVDRGMQANYSTLVDAYKRTELCAESKLALYRLSSIPVDRAEPSEALQVNTVWCEGLPNAKRLLCEAQVSRFRSGQPVQEELDVRGVRGAYLVQTELSFAPREQHRWTFVCEVEQDASAVGALDRALRDGDIGTELLEEDAAANMRGLVALVARADGLQCTGSALEDARHFANTLFNIMRGGVFEAGGLLPGRDLAAYVHEVAPALAAEHEALLADIPAELTREQAVLLATTTNDPDLIRVVSEYLPLLFSRRHGDPSRPWNAFSILTRGVDQSRYAYQGNWRDIFQNWEALCSSFPTFLEAVVSRFVNASTADGYNPYRITRAGFEWEVPDPDDPWAFIGYWGDHQLIYLIRLLAQWRRHNPAAMSAALSRGGHVYADVPYRILGYPSICRDPRNTIRYDAQHAESIAERVRHVGHEGRLVRDAGGALHRVTLAEKLLVPLLVKLTNFVPEIGLWLTTQRPEWNDANNALVGTGASVVTLAHLSTALGMYAELFEEAGDMLTLSVEVAELWRAVNAVLATPPPASSLLPADRRAIIDALGAAGEAHRGSFYDSGFSGAREQLPASEASAGLIAMRSWVDHSLRSNRRADGLYHAYNLLEFESSGGAQARRLPVMLEGQVAMLGSGLLTDAECIEVLEALRASDLYRADEESYMLYPDRNLPRFMEMNRLPENARERSRLVCALVKAGDRSVVIPGEEGALHFAAPLRNADILAAALRQLENGPHGALARAEHSLLLDLYEEAFDHAAFTGRSGTFYGYEGLGCIYWHQVSKLLLAVRELCDRPGTSSQLEARYTELRRGLGTHRSPAEYGAFPTDPYSHTPSFAGVQQPGMTGQVKEDYLARIAELGVHVDAGALRLGPTLSSGLHFVESPTLFEYRDGSGTECELALEPGSLALTCFQIPVVLHKGGEPRLVLTDSSGAQRDIPGFALGLAESAELFDRRSNLARIDVHGR
jgi:hypothetical protein